MARSDRMFFVACVTVLLGYLAGVIVVSLHGGDTSLVTSYLAAEPRTDWLSALGSGPAFVLGILCCGLFLFGWLGALPLAFYKAYGLGYTAGLFLSALGTSGYLPLALCLFPSALGICLLMAVALRDALPLSYDLFRGWLCKKERPLPDLKSYLLRSLTLFQCSSFLLLWDLFLAPLLLTSLQNR
ncbi:MAG: hypothetical protein IIX85_06590 [Clostridia bacterium]|nr:hypothetical protein [Clostridia bacterium]